MWTYLLIFAFVGFLCILESAGHRMSSKVLFFVISGIGVFVGLGDMLGGYDRYIYAELFDEIADKTLKGNYDYSASALNHEYYEIFYYLSNILISFITKNRYIFIFIFTCLIYVNIYNSIKNYSLYYAWTLLFFLGFWFFFTFTYLRQVMAVTIVWYAIKYVYKRELIKFLLVCFVAYQFHSSAVIFIPFYFFPIKKINKVELCISFLVVFLLGISGLPSSIFDSVGTLSGESDRINKYAQEAGLRLEYVLEVVIIMSFILRNYDKLFINRGMTMMTNMAICFCFVLVFFVNSSDGGRLSWYFLIGVFSTLSYIAFKCNINVRLLLASLSFALFFRILVSWGVLLSPYKSFLTPGVREGDYIEQQYEYDHNYDFNKFYR